MIVTIRTHASPDLGYGHVMRSLAVGTALAGNPDVDVRWQMTDDGDADPVTAAGFTVWRIPDTAADRVDAPWKTDAFLLDDPRISVAAMRAATGGNAVVAAFDDHRRFDGLELDLLIDYTRRVRDAAAGRLLLGPGYFPIRNGLSASPGGARPSGPRSDVVVVFGGSDCYDLTVPVCRWVAAALPNVETTAVYGAGYRGEGFAGAVPPGVQAVRDPPDLAARFTGASVVLSAAGATAFELAFLGCPAILVSLSDDQRPMAAEAARAGAAIDLGDWRALDPDRVVGVVGALLADAARRATMTDAGRRLVDGRGGSRIAAAIRDVRDRGCAG